MALFPDRTYADTVEAGDTATVAGWVHEKRTIGGLVFIELRDTTGRLQLKFEDETNPSLKETAEDVARQSAVVAEGVVEADERAPNGVELVPSSFEVIAEAERSLPLDPTGKVDAERSTRLDNRTLSLRAEEEQAIFEVRAAMLRAARDALRAHGATEITTPKIVATGTEGGAELFPITYFGREAFMNQSPQLFKQLAAGSALERVFEVGPIFRAEGSNTSRHLCEATSIDFEGAFCDADDAMTVVEDVVRYVYDAVEEDAGDALRTLGVEELTVAEGRFPRLSYEEAIQRVNSLGALDETLTWGDDLPTAAERALGESIGGHYFITEWPSEIKPFYIKDTDGEGVSTGFDLMHPRMELVSGGQREHRYEQLIEGFEQQGLPPEAFDYYTETFRYGIPPHAGWGLGADRLLMTMLDLPNIRDGVLFPRDQQRLSP